VGDLHVAQYKIYYARLVERVAGAMAIIDFTANHQSLSKQGLGRLIIVLNLGEITQLPERKCSLLAHSRPSE
jgi:hypothetical protein